MELTKDILKEIGFTTQEVHDKSSDNFIYTHSIEIQRLGNLRLVERSNTNKKDVYLIDEDNHITCMDMFFYPKTLKDLIQIVSMISKQAGREIGKCEFRDELKALLDIK